MNNFKVNTIFQLEKDKKIKSSEWFYYKMIKKYGLEKNDSIILYRKIINYQVKKYGESLVTNNTKDYLKEVMK